MGNPVINQYTPTPGSVYQDRISEYDWNGLYAMQTSERQNVVESWWNSEETADRDFIRQMMAQQYQNWYESAPEQMKRLEEAGINKNFGAAAIAGNASAGASPMQAPQTDANNPVSELANAVNAVTGGVKNATGALKDYVDSYETSALLPWKKIGLQVDTLLSLENIGLTRAQAQSVAIANQYDPIRFQLGIAKMRLELPILVQQERVFRAEYEKTMSDIEKNEQEMRESEAYIDLMSKQGFNEIMQGKRAQAEANLIGKRFELLNKMGWDPQTGLPGLFGTYLSNPDYNTDDLNNMADNLCNFAYDMAKYQFLGEHNLPLNDGRSLFELQTDADIATSYGSRKDIPVDVSVGPFKTSTNLRDFGHQHNNTRGYRPPQRPIHSKRYHK